MLIVPTLHPIKLNKSTRSSKSLKKDGQPLSSYRHAGGLQISRRFSDDDELKPDYSEGAIAEALNSATVALLLLMHTVFLSVHCPNEAEETGMLVQWDFGERLRAAAIEQCSP